MRRRSHARIEGVQAGVDLVAGQLVLGRVPGLDDPLDGPEVAAHDPARGWPGPRRRPWRARWRRRPGGAPRARHSRSSAVSSGHVAVQDEDLVRGLGHGGQAGQRPRRPVPRGSSWSANVACPGEDVLDRGDRPVRRRRSRGRSASPSSVSPPPRRRGRRRASVGRTARGGPWALASACGCRGRRPGRRRTCGRRARKPGSRASDLEGSCAASGGGARRAPACRARRAEGDRHQLVRGWYGRLRGASSATDRPVALDRRPQRATASTGRWR